VFAAVNGMAVSGIQAHLIRVEVDVSNGLPSFEIDGHYPINCIRPQSANTLGPLIMHYLLLIYFGK
jgi:hypothetical protein